MKVSPGFGLWKTKRMLKKITQFVIEKAAKFINLFFQATYHKSYTLLPDVFISYSRSNIKSARYE